MKQVNVFCAKYREIEHDDIIKAANCEFISRLDYNEFWSYTFRYLKEKECEKAVEELRSLFWPAPETKITIEDKHITAPVNDYERKRDRLLRKFVFLLKEADRQPCGGGCEYHHNLGIWIRNARDEYEKLRENQGDSADMSEVEDMLNAAVNRIANSVSSLDDGIGKMRDHINKTIYEIDKLARKADLGLSQNLPTVIDGHEWAITLGHGLQAPMFVITDDDGFEYVTLDSVIAKKSTRSREAIVGLFKILPGILKELELKAKEKLSQISNLLDSVK